LTTLLPYSTAFVPAHCLSVDFPEGCYDVAWSEITPNVLAAASADGTIQLVQTSELTARIMNAAKEHGREVSSLAWNSITRDRLLSTAHDGSILVVQILCRLEYLVASCQWNARSDSAD